MNQIRKFKRRKFVTGTGFRFGFVVVIIITFVLLLFVSEVVIYILLRRSAFSLPTVELQISVLRLGFWCMFGLSVFYILSCGIVILLSLRFVDRVLGPIPRLEKEIEEMLETGEYKELKIRKADILRDFILRINNLIQVLFAQRRKDGK